MDSDGNVGNLNRLPTVEFHHASGDPSRPTAEAVAIAQDRIRAVGSNEEVRRLANSKTRVVDARGRTIIPGLIDAHVHLLIAPEIVDERSLRDYERTRLPGILTNFLRHGITTIRSTGDPLPYIAQLRDRMDQALSGPRLIITGPNPSSPGGHPATTVCRNNPFCRRTLAREVENEEQARQVVRELVQAKVDAVKMVVDDLAIEGVPPLFDAIVAALVNETHRNGLRIIAHVSMSRDLEATTHLAELGVDEFVHPPLNYKNIPDSAGISQIAAVLVARKLPVTTTVSFSDGYKDAAGVERTTEGSPYTPAMRQCFERNLNAVGALADAGVKLVLGTDWFNGPVRFDDPRSLPGAQTLHEMELLHRAGLSTSAIVTAATRNAAEALGIVDRVGTIAEGKLADLAVLDGDLLQDFSALQRTVAVFKRGAVVSGSLPNR
ncbi:MAG TPA: amidohydrolase family protein [Vicinamibacterales bacterium]|nr:amidohydrolase family protein [Vicinamibacterales bacterium]